MLKRFFLTLFLILNLTTFAFAERLTIYPPGDVRDVGNCTSGSCFDGTSDGGSSLTFYHPSGNASLSYDVTKHDFRLEDDLDIEDYNPHLSFRDLNDNTAYQFHVDTSSPYQFALWKGTDNGTGFNVISPYVPLVYADSNDSWYFDRNTFIINAVNNRVGIKVAPAYTLDVNGTSYFEDAIGVGAVPQSISIIYAAKSYTGAASRGIYGAVTSERNSNTTLVRGLDFATIIAPTNITSNATLSAVQGVYTSGTVTMPTLVPVEDKTLTITNLDGFVFAGYSIDKATASGALTVTNAYALRTTDSTVANGATITTNYGIYLNTLASGTTDWQIYSVSGNWRIGDDNSNIYQGTGNDVLINYTGTYWDFDIAAATTAIRFNQSNFDTDFSVSGDTNDDIFYIDAGNERVGIGTNAPSARFNLLEGTLGNEALRVESTATGDDPNYKIFQNRVATTDATATTLHSVTLAADTTYLIEVRVVARRTGGSAGADGDSAGYKTSAVYKKVGAGIATIVGAATNELYVESQAGWDCGFLVSGNDVTVTVQGAVNNNVTWHGTIIVQNLSNT